LALFTQVPSKGCCSHKFALERASEVRQNGCI
jgi:hypothetical protein